MGIGIIRIVQKHTNDTNNYKENEQICLTHIYMKTTKYIIIKDLLHITGMATGLSSNTNINRNKSA